MEATVLILDLTAFFFDYETKLRRDEIIENSKKCNDSKEDGNAFSTFFHQIFFYLNNTIVDGYGNAVRLLCILQNEVRWMASAWWMKQQERVSEKPVEPYLMTILKELRQMIASASDGARCSSITTSYAATLAMALCGLQNMNLFRTQGNGRIRLIRTVRSSESSKCDPFTRVDQNPMITPRDRILNVAYCALRDNVSIDVLKCYLDHTEGNTVSSSEGSGQPSQSNPILVQSPKMGLESILSYVTHVTGGQMLEVHSLSQVAVGLHIGCQEFSTENSTALRVHMDPLALEGTHVCTCHGQVTQLALLCLKCLSAWCDVSLEKCPKCELTLHSNQEANN